MKTVCRNQENSGWIFSYDCAIRLAGNAITTLDGTHDRPIHLVQLNILWFYAHMVDKNQENQYIFINLS